MKIQKSFKDNDGKLYLVATPIGNLNDITLRGLEILKMVDVIACEDTRITIKLLNKFEINKKLISYHEHNKMVCGEKIINLLSEGKNVALVSDAGTPCISDPGYEIVKSSIENDFPVIPIPGASAVLSALVVSGLLPQPFTFIGFLERQKSKQAKQLEEYKYLKHSLIFYESPLRILSTLKNMIEVLGDRKIVVCREITKRYEEFIRGNISEILENIDAVKGEVVLIVDGSLEGNTEGDDWWESLSIEDHVDKYINDGFKKIEAIKLAAKDRGKKKQEIYNVINRE